VKLRDCHAVADSSDVRTFESRLVRVANDLDFGIISGSLVFDDGAGWVSSSLFGNTPEAFRTMTCCREIGKRDPLLQRLKRSSLPVAYDQAMYVREQAADLWDVQAAYGYKTGLAMSLHLPRNKHFIIGVDRESALPRGETSLGRLMADFQFLALYAHAAALRLLSVGPADGETPPRLTQREVEILKWTAEGKSAWTVGRILSTSEHNVNHHLRKILAKFDVGSKHQAAAKARSLGLI